MQASDFSAVEASANGTGKPVPYRDWRSFLGAAATLRYTCVTRNAVVYANVSGRAPAISV